ncbi:MAG: hypothetical protein ABIZ80_14205 [Bryobacteraceae bacterium]
MLKRTLLVLLALYVAAVAWRVSVRKFYIWMPDYVLRWMVRNPGAASGPVHVFVLFADHFEPGSNVSLMQRWEDEYPKFASRHRDADGRPAQHTWFYPGEQPIDRNMAGLQKLTGGGYGEVELHYHHGNDTQESTRRKFQDAVAYFQKFGFLRSAAGETHFAFVHGNWGLDNSNGPALCGANRELDLLRELGCFADFTFSSLWHESQPALVNSIYEAVDDDRPKSYDRGASLRLGTKPGAGLTIFEGPLVIAPTLDPRKLFFKVEDGDIHSGVPASQARVDLWVRANIHVEGRRDWIFIKLHGHGGVSVGEMDEAVGPHFDEALSYLERRYNDGASYVLHYITAREAYNLARAAAAGKQGDPRQYYDFAIPKYGEAAGPVTTAP